MSESRAESRGRREQPLVRRLTITIAIAAAVLVAVLLAAAFLPRWWAHRIGAQAGGNFTAGIALGLAYGFVFTVVPLAVLRWAFRKRRSVRAWAMLVFGALLVALPNLLTLAVVVGTGGAAHAGERTLDVEAPGFRNATLAGVMAAGLVFLVAGYLLTSRERTRAQYERLQDELRARDHQRAEEQNGAGAAPERPRPESPTD